MPTHTVPSSSSSANNSTPMSSSGSALASGSPSSPDKHKQEHEREQLLKAGERSDEDKKTVVPTAAETAGLSAINHITDSHLLSIITFSSLSLSEADENRANAIANLYVLKITALSFFLFVLAEIVGAIASNSLSLLGDASAMALDVSTYVISIFVEEFKLRNEGGKMSSTTLWLVDIGIPVISVVALLAVTAYISVDAVKVLHNPSIKDDVEVEYLYGFSFVNMIVDVISAAAFLKRGKSAFYEEKDGVYKLPSEAVQRTTRASKSLTQRIKHASTGQSDSECSEGLLGFEGGVVEDRQRGAVERRVPPVAERRVKKVDKNFNMISAWTHVGGDLLRTLAVFAAALVSSITGIDGDICDAWAAIVSGITIIVTF